MSKGFYLLLVCIRGSASARKPPKITTVPSELVRAFANLQLSRPLTDEEEGAVGTLPRQACHYPCDGDTRVALLAETVFACRGGFVGEGAGFAAPYVFLISCKCDDTLKMTDNASRLLCSK